MKAKGYAYANTEPSVTACVEIIPCREVGFKRTRNSRLSQEMKI
ncbi:hypothetical protein Barba22A_gp094 [Rheinheimera phage vB_RspM_Barba22A]|uniref:Uncharacterized protein n=83 Tax=Barbavirus TaxID=2733095 RepID=A0A7G9VRY3_9CAUD|nr:hypothetical protein HOV44_gp102 [Rheinheimera phage Barba5S]YP_009822834.1 hypothetical protein HOV45_gp098 [Rheinheimera phage Barba8S]YP_009822971.1 hypothetical protein HOV46_gp094 [Rheinheimera phage vB_RspM_Barba18A]YP_009823253.1 hypothetical protein HOV48_gp097 [Rheinheimera phage Barba21A]QCQ57945.1 hypothetical protein Barba1A_gp094 [Rheinheimera phage vB_RspM_Barba1A]QCQ58081.1 hypothetical protein Barba1S_gp094 [Rheinheimera phage vB_RspM_Barba1S]QCQ58217.1 hypothetical protein